MTNELPRLTRNHDGDLLLLVGETTTLVAKVGTPLWEAIVSAATPPAPAEPVSRAVREYARQLVERFENAARNCGNWHGMYQGKPMPHDVYEQFSSVRDKAIPELRAELLAALTATQQAEPSAKYLVCTGVVHEGEETYTVHDMPVPLADNWKLYTAPRASKEATPSAAEPVMLNGLTEAQTSATASVAGLDSQTPASTGVVSQKPVEVDDNPWHREGGE